jgi:UDP-N-acetylmuramate--alanine ligase
MKLIDKIYFVGIGGIGMSALARYFNAQSKQLAGYDKTSTNLTSTLIEEGIEVGFDEFYIPDWVLNDNSVLIVYTPAIADDHYQLKYFKNNGFELLKRSQMLGLITKDSFTIAVAGTHGKTTTSCILGHLLNSSDIGCTAFLGGISVNTNSNLMLSTSDIIVVEADEYDKSFLELNPDIAIITSVDPDHLDIYKNKQDFEDTFISFAKKIKPGGQLFVNESIKIDFSQIENLNVQTYSSLKQADNFANNLSVENNKQVFDVSIKNEKIRGLKFGLPGYHNIENALSAIAVACNLGVDNNILINAIDSFKGIKRRFEVHQKYNHIYVDDYAHHPQEIKVTLQAAKTLFPSKKMTVVFQPHLFSRTKDFYSDFARSLSLADEVILLDIYPARELPISGVDSNLILDQIKSEVKILLSKKELLESLKNKRELLLTLGAGDISKLVEPINEIYA